MKEEVRRIMRLVQEGKLSPDDAAELIDAFAASESHEMEEPTKEPSSSEQDSGSDSASQRPRDPFKGFVDAMEKLGKDIREIDWTDVASQVREKAAKGVEGIKAGVEKIREGKWGWLSQEIREVTLPLSVPEGKLLRIENPSGDVKIVRVEGLGSVRATARFRGHDDLDAKEKADQYTLIVEESEPMVLIRQPDVSGLEVDLYVEVSETVGVSVHTDSGEIDIEDTGAGAKVNCRSGDVKLRGLNGSIEVNLNDGDLVVEDCESPAVSVESKSGDLTFRRLKGNLTVRTANGDISAIECGCPTVSLESVSGSISLTASDPVTGTVNLRTVNGDVSVHLPVESDCRVTLSTLRGSVSCAHKLVDESRGEQRLTGRIGDGKGIVDISAVNGDVTLGIRAAAAHK